MRRQINSSTEQLCVMREKSALSVILFIIWEMHPECVIASWDALVFLLDAENIERWVQLNAEKNRVYANHKLQEKTVTRYASLCFVKTISISWLALHGKFRCKFSH